METAIQEKKRQDGEVPAANTQEPVRVSGGLIYRVSKRIFDLLAALVMGAILILPMVIIGILVRIDSKGPAIYKQERLGKDGKPFMLYKFRSMCENAEENGPQWADTNDERCTKIGAALRRTRLDELPQLLNIIKGEMSFVGPRPERACFYDLFETYIPGFRNRLVVTPGLTGHAQVNGGYDLMPEEKIVYDMEYIAKRSFRMDIQCILKTVVVMFSCKGAR